MRRIAAFAAAWIVAGCATLVTPSPSHEIVAYYPAWAGVFSFDASRVTVVNYAFFDLCWDGKHGNGAVEALAPCEAGNGSLVPGHPHFDSANLEALRKVKHDHPHVRLVASVGGWNRSNRFSDMASAPEARARFIESTIALFRGQGFDGIDIDWEYPGAIGIPCAAGHASCDRSEDKANFATLGRELRAALDRAGAIDHRHYLFTVAAGADAKYVFDASGRPDWLVDLARSTDWINLMTYDYHGTWERAAYFVAPLARDPADPHPANVMATVDLFLAQGIEPAKLTLGAPFYGKGWRGCAPTVDGSVTYQPCSGLAREDHEASFEFAYLTDEGLLSKDAQGRYTAGGRGFVRHWNAAAQAPWLYNPGTQVFIAYDDEASVRAKARYAMRMGLRGVMFWELAQDSHGVLGQVLSEEVPRN